MSSSELSERLELVRQALANAPGVVFALDAEGRFALAEGGALERCPAVPAVLVGCSAFEVFAVWPDALDLVRRALAGENVSGSLDSGAARFDLSLGPARDSAGAPAGAVGLLLDASARTRAEQALRESEARLTALVENAPIDFWAMARDGHWVMQNRISRELWGDYVGQSFDVSVIREDLRRLWELTNSRALGGEVVEGEVRYRLHGGDRYYHSIVAPIRGSGDEIQGIVGINLDLTPRKLAEQALRLSEERWRSLVASAPLCIHESDLEGRLLVLNPAGRALLGLDPGDDLTGRSYLDVAAAPDRERLRAALERVLQGDICEIELEGARGAALAASLLPLRAADDSIQRIMGLTQDVTARRHEERQQRRAAEQLEGEVARRTQELERANRELRALQGQLVDAQRMAAAGELAAGIAHAINNPLASLIGTVQMRLEAAARRDPYDERILGLARRIHSIVEGMLAVSRQAELELEPTEPTRLLEDVRAQLRGRPGAAVPHVEVRAGPELPSVRVDRELMTTALLAIAENGIEAMDAAGKLTLAARRLPGLPVVAFEIADSGPGIAPELAARVFEPFFTTKPKGTGLGLAIAYGIVRGHDGRICIERAPGGGALVRIEIPV